MRGGSVAAGARLLLRAAVDGCVRGSDGACRVVERRGFSSGCATQRSGSNNWSVDCSVRARARPTCLRPRADRSGWSTPRQLQRPGRAGRETGGRWRVHSVFDLARERFTTFELTDESEGEVIDRIAEIRVGDRAYLQPDQIAGCSTPVPTSSCAPDGTTRAGLTARQTASLSSRFSKRRGKGFIDRPT